MKADTISTTSLLAAPCCERCTHTLSSPCADMIECLHDGPICHDDDACRQERRRRRKAARRGGEGTLLFVGAGTCGRANGSARVVRRINEFLDEHPRRH